MTYRSVWKGFLRLALITCPVKLYAATGEAERRHFNQINTATGNKIETQRIDAVTGDPVEKDDVGRGVEIAAGKYAHVTDEEIAGAAPESAHTVKIEELVPRGGIPWLFPDAHYYLGPDGLAAGEAFALIRDGIRNSRMIALGQLTLHSREHLVAIEPGDVVLRLSTLRYAAEVRAEDDCFPGLATLAAPDEFIDAVGFILDRRKAESFDPSRFADRYAAALAELVIAKVQGKMVARRTTPPPALMDLEKAVKRSQKFGGKKGRAA